MKKIYIMGCLLSMLPMMVYGENARIAELTRQKQEKMERLQKCEGTTKALKIAGLSTIGLTAVGVVGNVVEAQKLQQYQSQSKSLDSGITKTKQEIADKEAEIAKKKQEEANLIEEIRKDIGLIKLFDANNLIGKEIRLSYTKTDIPNEIRSELDAAIDEFKNKCKTKYGVDKVNTESSDSNVFAICECKYGKKDNEDACNETPTPTPEPVVTSFVNCTETGATENAKCTGVDHAKNAHCKKVGSDLKCFATLCEDNYLVRVKNGYCKTEAEATAECQKANLVVNKVPADGVANAGYKCISSGRTSASSTTTVSTSSSSEIDNLSYEIQYTVPSAGVGSSSTQSSKTKNKLYEALASCNESGKYLYVIQGTDDTQRSDSCKRLKIGQWMAVFNSNRIAVGNSKCSSTAGVNIYDIKMLNSTDSGEYCWCQEAVMNDQGIISGSSYPKSWVYVDGSISNEACKQSCAYVCAGMAQKRSDFRNKLAEAAEE